jgi:hypothetical protein
MSLYFIKSWVSNYQYIPRVPRATLHHNASQGHYQAKYSVQSIKH